MGFFKFIKGLLGLDKTEEVTQVESAPVVETPVVEEKIEEVVETPVVETPVEEPTQEVVVEAPVVVVEPVVQEVVS